MAGRTQEAEQCVEVESIYVASHTCIMRIEVKVKSLSCVWLFATLWAVARQAPLSVGFSRQEY